MTKHWILNQIVYIIIHISNYKQYVNMKPRNGYGNLFKPIYKATENNKNRHGRRLKRQEHRSLTLQINYRTKAQRDRAACPKTFSWTWPSWVRNQSCHFQFMALSTMYSLQITSESLLYASTIKSKDSNE